MSNRHTLQTAPELSWTVDVARRAVVYRDNLRRKYEQLAVIVDTSNNTLEVRKAIYTLACVQDELAKISWVVGRE